MMEALMGLEAEHPEWADPNSPSQRVGGDLADGFEKVPHREPMLSLSNSYNEQDIAEWAERVDRLLEGDSVEWVMELKYDGVAISLTYEKGKLVQFGPAEMITLFEISCLGGFQMGVCGGGGLHREVYR